MARNFCVFHKALPTQGETQEIGIDTSDVAYFKPQWLILEEEDFKATCIVFKDGTDLKKIYPNGLLVLEPMWNTVRVLNSF